MAIATTLVSTFLSYRNALRAADDFLKSQALTIAASLSGAIAKYGTGENILKDIPLSGRWEGIAFLALYREDGLTILHSNENLIHKRTGETGLRRAAESGAPSFRYQELGTGEEVAVLDYPFHHRESILILRVALHTYPARAIVREARFQSLSVLGIVSVLSLVTTFFLIALKRKEALEKRLEEKEKLSAIGEMASILAHEIRNPLGSIKGFAQYLKEQSAGEGARPAETTGQYLDIIIAESKRLENLTEDLLTYARQDEIRAETFALSTLVPEVVAMVIIPPHISFTTEIESSLLLTSDKEKLRFIVANLLRNAIEAVSDGGSVAIRAEGNDTLFFLRVSDSGPGIAGNDIQKIFRPFYTTKTSGTGLGLAIVDRYTRAIGGTIEVESRAGGGSTFSLVLPKTVKGK